MSKDAQIPNPSLQSLAVLVGEWSTVGAHPLMPGVTLHGRVTFEWIEGGAFLRMYSEQDDPKIPNGIVIFGSDNESEQIFMSYFDSRGISRKYDFSINGVGNGKTWKWWRDHPGFSQRFTVQIEDNGNKMIGHGEICKDGATWESDLDLTYTRVN
jgi:hypothetical protein